MSMIKLSISTISFLAVAITSCLPSLADSSYTAVIQKINIRGDRLFADDISKIGSKTNILELADAIGKIIDNVKLLPSISISLGTIPLQILDKSLKAKGIQVTYYQYSCLSMRPRNNLPINLRISAILDSDPLPKSILPVLIADHSFLAQGKPGSSSTGQTDKCHYSTVNPARFHEGDRNLKLRLSKQGYMVRELGFKVVATENAQPVFKFDDSNLTLEDERTSQTVEFLIDGGSTELKVQILKQITKNHPRFYYFITNKSASEILNLKNPPVKYQGPRPMNSFDAVDLSYPDYIIKLDVSQ